MNSKISTIVFCCVLAGSNCWAAAVAEDPAWFFDNDRNVFVFKQNKELTKEPRHFIMDCAQKGDLERLAWVLSTKSVSPNYCDKSPRDVRGATPLSAVIYGSLWYYGQHADCVRLLLQQGADPNADYSRCLMDSAPILSLAVEYGVVEVVAALLKGGADITLLDDKKLSVFSYLNKIAPCLVQQHSLRTEQEAAVIREKVKKILLRHCADLLFRALDQHDRREFDRLFQFLCARLFGECGVYIEEVLVLQNDRGMNVLQYGIQKSVYVKMN